MMVARWSIDARFGYEQNVIDRMQRCLRETAPQVGLSAEKSRLLTGSIGAPFVLGLAFLLAYSIVLLAAAAVAACLRARLRPRPSHGWGTTADAEPADRGDRKRPCGFLAALRLGRA